ncbi:hypothetical protein KIN20_012113 [Parelaphostrongylus tenuis]|uniref:Uncharacterized protein n=1 Tax=Parelaphostrongylus tenuis TaxID=148309 RepID=A0AAD5QK80_PARTN|nr:hypothetical protein KIN20_012113 [Parelaphostrongylus tenuis]
MAHEPHHQSSHAAKIDAEPTRGCATQYLECIIGFIEDLGETDVSELQIRQLNAVKLPYEGAGCHLVQGWK